MGLGDFFKKKSTPKQPQVFEYVLANSFRGFKRYIMVVHGDQEAEKNNESFKDCVLSGKLITFTEGVSKNYKDPFLLVYIDGKKVGAIFDAAEVQSMLNRKIESVYAKMEVDKVVGRKSENSKELVTEIRNRVKLFVKYSD